MKSTAVDFLEKIRDLFTHYDPIIDVQIRAWRQGYSSDIVRYSVTPDDIDDLQAFVNGLNSPTGFTDFRVAFPAAFGPLSFFGNNPQPEQRNAVLFLSSGIPTTGLGPPDTPQLIVATTQNTIDFLVYTYAADIWVANINEADTSWVEGFDSTQGDAIPNITTTGEGLDFATFVGRFSLFAHFDLNPAHLIRELLTDPDFGLAKPEAEIGPTFAAVADEIFEEKFGLSFLWDRSIETETFLQEVCKHIDAAVYVDRRTGLYEMRLIRGDYVIEELPEFGPSDILSLDNATRPAFGELTNSVTIRYASNFSRKDGAVSAQDPALAQMQGSEINTTFTYPGISNFAMAARVADRNLRALSFPLWSFAATMTRAAADLKIGDVFRISFPDYGWQDMVCRVTGIDYGDGRDQAIKVQASQDVFSLPARGTILSGGQWVPPSLTPLPSPVRVVGEMPYYELVASRGQSTVDDELAIDPNQGFLLAAGGKPNVNTAINANTYIDEGSGYVLSTALDFSPHAYLDGAITRSQTVIPITGGVLLAGVVVGQHTQMGEEIVRVDASSSSSLTLGRGLFDTVPVDHEDGTPILFWDQFPATNSKAYLLGEDIDVKIAPVAGAGELPLEFAPIDVATFNARAIRPYPPGRLSFFSDLTFPVSIGSADIPIAWAHRDRRQQTSPVFADFLTNSIGPEPGTTYEIKLYDETDALARTISGLSGTSRTYTEELEDLDTLCQTPSGIFQTFTYTPPVVPTSGLVAAWLFRTGNGTSLPEEKGNHPGTLVDGPYFRPNIAFPYRAVLAGLGQIDLADFPLNGLASFSVSLWWKATGLQQPLLASYNPALPFTSPGVAIRSYTSGAYILLRDSGGDAIEFTGASDPITPDPNDGAWHHWVLTYNGGTKTAQVYLDGTLRHTKTNAAVGSLDQSSFPHHFGYSSVAAVSRTRIYNRVINLTEVGQLFAEEDNPDKDDFIIPTNTLTGWTAYGGGGASVSGSRDYDGDGQSLRKNTGTDNSRGLWYALPVPFSLANLGVEVDVRFWRQNYPGAGIWERIFLSLASGDAVGSGCSWDSASVGRSALASNPDLFGAGATTTHDSTVYEWRRMILRIETPDVKTNPGIWVTARVYSAAGVLLVSTSQFLSKNNGIFERIAIAGAASFWVDALKVTLFGPAYTAGVPYRYNSKIRARVSSWRSGWESYQAHDHTMYRNGWGYRYGSSYGGA
jgi:hypothetical protein